MTLLPSTALTFCILGAAVLAAQIQPSGQNRDAEAAVRRLSAEEVEAFLRNDSDALARLWSDDLVVTNPLNTLVGKRDVLRMIDSGFLAITSYERHVEYARVYDDVVILAGSERVVWGGRMPNAGRPENLRFTAVWTNQLGRWREVARHANIVRQQPASEGGPIR